MRTRDKVLFDTEMACLPDGQKMRICLAVTTECRRVKDGQTSRNSTLRAMHSIAR